MNKLKLSAIAAALALAVPLTASAESDVNTGSGTITASADLDFQIVIPRILFLQVGTGTLLADNATVDLLTFTVPAASVGTGTPVAATGGNAPGNPSGVTARLISNGGATVNLSSTTLGALNNGNAAETISWAQISSSSNNALLPAPTLVNGGTTSVALTATNRVINQSAVWTYSYLNTVTPASGTYGGVNVNNGRATYTASMP